MPYCYFQSYLFARSLLNIERNKLNWSWRSIFHSYPCSELYYALSVFSHRLHFHHWHLLLILLSIAFWVYCPLWSRWSICSLQSIGNIFRPEVWSLTSQSLLWNKSRRRKRESKDKSGKSIRKNDLWSSNIKWDFYFKKFLSNNLFCRFVSFAAFDS